MTSNDGNDVEKIGDTKHGARNVVVGIGLVVAALGIGGYYAHERNVDAPKLEALASFSASYAEKCDVPELRGGPSEYVSNAYLNRSDLQALLVSQREPLAQGRCDDVARALRAGGFPMHTARTE